jgi:hypothetical protein
MRLMGILTYLSEAAPAEVGAWKLVLVTTY